MLCVPLGAQIPNMATNFNSRKKVSVRQWIWMRVHRSAAVLSFVGEPLDLGGRLLKIIIIKEECIII